MKQTYYRLRAAIRNYSIKATATLILCNSTQLFAQSSNTVLDFQGSAISQTLSPNRTSSTTSTTRTIAFDASSAGQLYASSNSQQQFSGGMKITYPNGSVGNFNATLRSTTDGWEPGKFLAYTDASGNPSYFTNVFVWPKSKFLNGGSSNTVSFDNNNSNSHIIINVGAIAADVKELRMVIKNGSNYYISEYVISATGTFTFNGFNNSSTAGKRWGAYTPSTLAIPSPLPSFSAVNFNDVQEVGFVYNGGRPSWGHSFNFTRFTVKAMVGTPDTQAPSVPTGLSSASVTQNSFTLNWSASTDNVGVTAYEVFRNGTSLGTTSNTNFNVTGLTAGTAYSMTVRARDAAGNWSAQSSALSVTTQSATPTGYRYFRFVALSGTTTYDIYLEEIDFLVGSTVYPATNYTGSNAAITASHSVVDAWKLFDGVKNSTSIWGPGTTTYPVWVAIDLGSGVSINPTEVQIAIEWNARTPASFRIEGSNNNSTWTTLYTRTGLTQNDWVRDATNNFVFSGGGGSTDTQAPSVPSGLSSSNITQNSFTLNWTASSDNVGVTGYEVFRNGTSIGTPSTNSFNVTGLSAGTAYNMTVRARDAAGNWSAQSSALSVTTQSSGGSTSRVNMIGMNLGNPGIDYNFDKVFADAMRSHRQWDKISGGAANLDANYWPTEDARVLVYHGLNTNNNHGTYKMTFNGQATLSTGDATISNQSYNSSTNITSADLIISSSTNSQLFINFTNTKRTSTSATNTGVTNVKLMRPISAGSSQSYASTAVFNTEYINQLAPFKCIRGLGWSAINSCGDSLWSDRTLWTHASQSPPALPGRTYGWEGRGASWESLIMFANETGKDLWINIPHKATNDYITNLANLIKNGNSHVAPLRSDVKLYVEYSNEIWNWAGAFRQTPWTRDKARNYGMPLTFDGETDENQLMYRYKALRTVEISNIFRSVFGDAQMMTRVRPLLCWQQAYNDLTSRTLLFIDRWFNKRDSRSTVATARPINYFIYGGGGSTYWYPDNNVGLTIDNIWNRGTFNTTNFINKLYNDAAWAKAFGLVYLAYEGDTHPNYDGDENLMRNNHFDPRMNADTYAHLQAWNKLDGELFNFLALNGAAPTEWAVRNVINPANSPQLDAINNFNDDVPLAVAVGSVAPFTRAGGAYDVLNWQSANPNGSGNVSLSGNTGSYATAYTFRVNSTGTYNVRIQYSTTSSARLVVEYAGGVIGDFNLASTGGASAYTSYMNINCTFDKLYSIRVVAASGTVTIQNVIVGSGAAREEADLSAETVSKEVNVFPNPAQGSVNINAHLPEADVLNINVYSQEGRVVLSRVVEVESGYSNTKLDISTLPSGLYMVKIAGKHTNSNIKMIVE